MPSSSAARLDRSKLRPRTCGPRSLIRTVTDFPVLGLVTITLDPIGKVLEAAVISSGSNTSPLAVRRPAISSPWYDALTEAVGCARDCGGGGGGTGAGAGATAGGG